MIKKLLLAAMIAAPFAALPTVSTAQASIDIRIGPPAPRYEAVPAPRAGYVWAPGYWDWRRNHHVWVGGHWERARRGYVYASPRWEQHDGHWQLNRGHWNRGDRDHDGVPNGRDRRPDDPHRR